MTSESGHFNQDGKEKHKKKRKKEKKGFEREQWPPSFVVKSLSQSISPPLPPPITCRVDAGVFLSSYSKAC
jgi:hypothetical protein